MKKITKLMTGIVLTAAFATTAGVLAGCNAGGNGGEKTGEAYSLVHNGGYVGCAKITVDGDSVKSLSLTEICLPTQISYKGTSTESADAAKAALDAQYRTDDFVVVSSSSTKTDQNTQVTTTTYTATAYYKTVKYGSVTMTYDGTANAYKVGNSTVTDYMQSANNAKAYYEAVASNSVSVVVGGQEKKDVMTNAALNKDENGYWTKKDSSNNNYSRWKLNRDATVKYVLDNGTGKLNQLTKPTESNGTDVKDGSAVKYWTDGTVTTGATWNDLNPAPKEGETRNYKTYAELILSAKDAAK